MSTPRLTLMRIAAVVLIGSVSASCGSGSPSSPTEAPHTLPLTVMIMSTGPLPGEVTIAIGDRVSFMNHDTVPHGVSGGPDPTRPDCSEIDVVGILSPGDTRSTAPFTSAKTCEFHDPRFQSAAFKGRIVIR